jgi:hypothetical protein
MLKKLTAGTNAPGKRLVERTAMETTIVRGDGPCIDIYVKMPWMPANVEILG